jgi:lipoprotein-releasing system ATP-binding protein
MNKPTILNAEKLSKSYVQADGTPLQILNDFSCEVNAGEMVALVGPSGSGKSTLLHILGLLDQTDKGDLHINGNNVTKLNEVKRTNIRRSDIGFVYQFHHLLPEFSAVENIMLPQIINGVGKAEASQRAMDLLSSLKLSKRADSRPAKLSGGEQQRVAIARALANNPKLILADEPTGNLDPETAEEVFKMFKDLVQKSGVGALIATHNMDLAKRMDRVIQF